jgi:hypothetical protein
MKNMKWYLASRSKYNNELKKIEEILNSNNHEVVSSWIYIDENIQPFKDNLVRSNEIVNTNMDEMMQADILLVINDKNGRDIFTELEFIMCRNFMQENSCKIYILGEPNITSLMQNHKSIIHMSNIEEVLKQENINYQEFDLPNFN